ncbi:hypothetical protein [Flavobacterium sp.]|uniref:hypothetical protein n=1 Tax=Flavobacterium sp. TaxID=239 RepID=UPI0038FC3E09
MLAHFLQVTTFDMIVMEIIQNKILQLMLKLATLSKISRKTLRNINLEPAIGVVLNNQAQYYSTSNYNKPSLVNLGIKITQELELDNRFSLPIYLNYICNPSIVSTEQLGKIL